MIQNVLRAIGGVEVYGIISICLFFAVFTGTLIFAFAKNKSFLKTMSALPLEDEFVVASGILPDVEGGILPPGYCCEHPVVFGKFNALPPSETLGSTSGETPDATLQNQKGNSQP